MSARGVRTVLVAAALGDGQHIALVLYRPGAQQDLPVRAPRGFGESRRNDQ